MKPVLSIVLFVAALSVTSSQAADQWLDSITKDLQNLPAPEHPIPQQPVSQKDRPLPNGQLRAEMELKWRALYGNTLQKRAAERIVHVGVDPSNLQRLVGQVDQANDTTPFPPIENLQDPRAVPALRGALARMKDPMHRYFALEALYKSGDWNHSSELVDLFNSTKEDASALQLLGVYHPEIGVPMALEIAGLAGRHYVAKDKKLYGAHVELAFEVLEQDRYAGYQQALLTYFQKWPAPVVAGKLGDYRVVDAQSLISAAAANAKSSAYFNAFTCQKFYQYALARFGNRDSVNWMLAQDKALINAPNAKEDFSGYLKWQDKYGDVAAFYNLLVKLQTKQAVNAYTTLLVRETRQGVHTISAKGLMLADDSLAVDALADYFAQTDDLERSWDLTEPKRILALYSTNPKAAALMQKYIPDPDKRTDLISIADEFGPDGLVPQPPFSSFHRPLQ